MEESKINYSVNEQEGITIIKLDENRVDSMKSPSLKTDLLKIIADGTKKLLINMGTVKTIDSSGMGALTFGKRQIEAIGGELAICEMQEKVKTVFRIAKLDTIFMIFESETDCLKNWK